MNSSQEMVVKIRAPIYPEKGGTQSLIIDTPKEPVENLAEYLGYDEPKIIDWLLKDFGFKTILFEKLFIGKKNVCYLTAIQEPFTRNRENPGDIDIIALSEIYEAIAFECKIVKATSQKDVSVKINKADKLQEGAKQANDYLKFGFSQVYFLIVILDDGRNYNNPNFIFNNTSMDDLSNVYNGNWKEELDKKIGIIYCSIEQTRNLSIHLNNNISLDVERFAAHHYQNECTTTKLKTLKKVFFNFP